MWRTCRLREARDFPRCTRKKACLLSCTCACEISVQDYTHAPALEPQPNISEKISLYHFHWYWTRSAKGIETNTRPGRQQHPAFENPDRLAQRSTTCASNDGSNNKNKVKSKTNKNHFSRFPHFSDSFPRDPCAKASWPIGIHAGTRGLTTNQDYDSQPARTPNQRLSLDHRVSNFHWITAPPKLRKTRVKPTKLTSSTCAQSLQCWSAKPCSLGQARCQPTHRTDSQRPSCHSTREQGTHWQPGCSTCPIANQSSQSDELSLRHPASWKQQLHGQSTSWSQAPCAAAPGTSHTSSRYSFAWTPAWSTPPFLPMPPRFGPFLAFLAVGSSCSGPSGWAGALGPRGLPFALAFALARRAAGFLRRLSEASHCSAAGATGVDSLCTAGSGTAGKVALFLFFFSGSAAEASNKPPLLFSFTSVAWAFFWALRCFFSSFSAFFLSFSASCFFFSLSSWQHQLASSSAAPCEGHGQGQAPLPQQLWPPLAKRPRALLQVVQELLQPPPPQRQRELPPRPCLQRQLVLLLLLLLHFHHLPLQPQCSVPPPLKVLLPSLLPAFLWAAIYSMVSI